MPSEISLESRLRAVGRLAEPLRSRLYDVVAACDEPVSREHAAAAVGISRSLAAYHLDTMARDGLLSVSYARTSGRTGPGAGRPAKLYRRCGQELTVTVPQREYQLAATLLAAALEAEPTGAAVAALADGAYRLGVQAGEEAARGDGEAGDRATRVRRLLTARGYEPRVDRRGMVRMRNCPFHRLVEEHRDLVCGMNLALVRGMLDGLDGSGGATVLDPTPGCCCVALAPER
jgi:predicted ArsR family transcriptional regulator